MSPAITISRRMAEVERCQLACASNARMLRGGARPVAGCVSVQGYTDGSLRKFEHFLCVSCMHCLRSCIDRGFDFDDVPAPTLTAASCRASAGPARPA